MAMVLTEAVDAADPTHRLVTRRVAGEEHASTIQVENRAVSVCMDYGTAVHLELDPEHDQYETVRRELERVPDSACLFPGSEHEFRASLPEGRTVVESVLEVPVGANAASDAFTLRLFSVARFAVVTDQSWLYRSVPHETHIREINTVGHEGMIADLNATLAQVRGSAVVPFGDLTSWTADGVTYSLDWDALHRSNDGTDVSYDVARLRQVTVLPFEPLLRLDWAPTAEASVLRRAVWRVLGSERARPPARVEIPAGSDGDEVVAAFRELRAKLGYAYDVDTPSD